MARLNRSQEVDRLLRRSGVVVILIAVMASVAAVADQRGRVASDRAQTLMPLDLHGQGELMDFSAAGAAWPSVTIGPVIVRYPPTISAAGASFLPPRVSQEPDGSIEYDVWLTQKEDTFPVFLLSVIPNPSHLPLNLWVAKFFDSDGSLIAAGDFKEYAYMDGHHAFIGTDAPLPSSYGGVLGVYGLVESSNHTRIVTFSPSQVDGLILPGYSASGARAVLWQSLVENMIVRD